MFEDFNILPQSIIVLDEKRKVTFVNKAYTDFSGLEEKELIGENYDSLKFYEDESTEHIIDFKDCLIHGGEIQRQVFVEDKNNRLKAVFVSFFSKLYLSTEYSIITFQDLNQIIKCEYYINQSEISRDKSCSFEGLIGCHQSMRDIYRLIELAADSDVNVLICGESGTGKEMVAKAIHNRSKRKDGPFIAVNCSALSENLLESELFGHIKGSFTGAIKDKIGKFEAAQTGTIFLDEIAEISPFLQVKLLRVLQERKLEKVGDNKLIDLDIRILAATNKNLKDEVSNGQFREDLFYRLNVFPVQTVSLHKRKTDIPLLVKHFMEVLNKKTGKNIKRLSQTALTALMDYDWPGNVRQLENMIEYAFVLASDSVIEIKDLPKELKLSEISIKPNQNIGKSSAKRKKLSRQELLSIIEKNNGSRINTARELGISKVALWKKMKKFGMIDS